MTTADRYSRLVLWLKIALPIMALAILSTLFFVAETLDPEAAIPYAKVDVERILREQGVTRPTFGGVTENGAAIALTAEYVRPDADGAQTLTGYDLAATLDLPSGAHVEVTSPEGIVDADSQTVILRGGAFLESSTGYRLTTDKITASIADGTVIADGQVNGSGPIGDFQAGHMVLAPTKAGGSTYNLVFSSGVRLKFQPGS